VDHFSSFEEFWPHYLGEHADRTNRTLHAVGTASALVALSLAVVTKKPRLAAFAPVLGYGPAWIGHFLIEKNRPATFRHPAWSLRADLRMLRLMSDGGLAAELRRLGIDTDVDASLAVASRE
jgi:hypothetical protein